MDFIVTVLWDVMQCVYHTASLYMHQTTQCNITADGRLCNYYHNDFGGLGVRILASGTQVRGFESGRSHRIF
jgi:hypothetical protein